MVKMIAASAAEEENLATSARLSPANDALWHQSIGNLELEPKYLMRALIPTDTADLQVNDFLAVLTAAAPNAAIGDIVDSPIAIFQVSPHYRPVVGVVGTELPLLAVAMLENASSDPTPSPSEAPIVVFKIPVPGRFLAVRAAGPFFEELSKIATARGKTTVLGKDDSLFEEKPTNKSHVIADLDGEKFIDHSRDTIHEKMRNMMLVIRLFDPARREFLVLDNKLNDSRLAVLKGHCTSDGQSIPVGGLTAAFPRVEGLMQIRHTRIFSEPGHLKAFLSGQYRNYQLSAANDPMGIVSLKDFTSGDLYASVDFTDPTQAGHEAIASALSGVHVALEALTGVSMKDSYLVQMIDDLRCNRASWRGVVDLYILSLIETRFFAWLTSMATIKIDLVEGYIKPTAAVTKSQRWINVLDEMLAGLIKQVTPRPNYDFLDSALRSHLTENRRKVKAPLQKVEIDGDDSVKKKGKGKGKGGGGDGKNGGKGGVKGGRGGGGDEEGKDNDGAGNKGRDGDQRREAPICLLYLAQRLRVPRYVSVGCDDNKCSYTHRFEKIEKPKAGWIAMVKNNNSQNQQLKDAIVLAFEKDKDK